MEPTALEQLFQRSVNVYLLQQRVDEIVMGVASGAHFHFSADLLRELHGLATQQLLENNGAFRNHDVHIQGSPHVPPPHLEVAAHVESLCAFVQAKWEEWDLVALSAFVLWRLNWVHPFSDGNGRTSRAASYLVLCAKHGRALPGTNTVLVQLMNARAAYCQALRDCDSIYLQTGSPEHAIQPLAAMLSSMLVAQLKDCV